MKNFVIVKKPIPQNSKDKTVCVMGSEFLSSSNSEKWKSDQDTLAEHELQVYASVLERPNIIIA